MNPSLRLWPMVLGGALFAAACGDSKSSMNPVAPSAVVIDASQSDDSGGGVSSTTAKNDKDKDKGKNGNGNGKSGPGNGQPTAPTAPAVPGNVTPPSNTTPPAPVTAKVELEGRISAKSSTTITVNAQVISVPSTAVIRHGNTRFKLSDLRVGDRVHVKATRSTTGTGTAAKTAILATEIKRQNPGDPVDEEDDE